MKVNKKEIIFLIFGAVFSIILANLGAAILRDFSDRPALGLAMILLAFLLIYFSSYLLDIRNLQDKFEEIEKKTEKYDKEREIEKKLLNTIRDIILLDKERGKK